MYNLLKIFPMVFLITIINFFPIQVYSQTENNITFLPSTYGLPDSIGGYTALAVITSENTACLPDNYREVILQVPEPRGETSDEMLTNFDLEAVSNELKLFGASEWSLTLAGTFLPTVPASQILSQLIADTEDWNNLIQQTGCITLAPFLAPAQTGSHNQQYHNPVNINGFIFIENTDAGLYTDDNAQNVNLIAPNTSYYQQPSYSVFTNNVNTDTGYFIQTGFLFPPNTNPSLIVTPRIVYTTTTLGLYSKDYKSTLISYQPTHSYYHQITYTSGLWWTCVRDNTISGQNVCEADNNPSTNPGTTLKYYVTTGIFVENGNLQSALYWTTGMNSPWEARGAKIYRNGVGQNWSSEHWHSGFSDYCYDTDWPPNYAISGTLVGNASAFISLPNVPFHCP